MPVPEIKPHTEVQCQAYVSGDLQDMVWGQPDLGLSIKEGKEIEAGRSDADFVCNVDADLLCSQCGLTEGDPGLPTTRASPVQKDLQTTSGGQGLSFIFIGLAGPGGGPPVPQWHALDSWLGYYCLRKDRGDSAFGVSIYSLLDPTGLRPSFEDGVGVRSARLQTPRAGAGAAICSHRASTSPEAPGASIHLPSTASPRAYGRSHPSC